MRKLRISLAPAAAVMAGMAATLQASAQASTRADGRLEATFTNSDVSVTPGLGMTELLPTGTGTVVPWPAWSEAATPLGRRVAPDRNWMAAGLQPRRVPLVLCGRPAAAGTEGSQP